MDRLEKTMDEKSKVSESLRRHLKDCVAHVTVSSTEQEDNNHFLKTLCSNTRALMDADDVLVKEEDFIRAASRCERMPTRSIRVVQI